MQPIKEFERLIIFAFSIVLCLLNSVARATVQVPGYFPLIHEYRNTYCISYLLTKGVFDQQTSGYVLYYICSVI